jgi:hypothetical protein
MPDPKSNSRHFKHEMTIVPMGNLAERDQKLQDLMGGRHRIEA